MTKASLRKEYLYKRKTLSHKDILMKTDLILIQFQHLVLPEIEMVLSYKPIINKNEIDTKNFERYIELINPSVTFCYPFSDLNSETFSAIVADNSTEFVNNIWGIDEPQSNTIADPKDIDLVFLPLLAFDEKGYRVGYGKGFYDKFLSDCRDDIIKIGFSYFPPTDKIEDVDNWDIPLNFAVTPDTVYAF